MQDSTGLVTGTPSSRSAAVVVQYNRSPHLFVDVVEFAPRDLGSMEFHVVVGEYEFKKRWTGTFVGG